jgi:hypothetical protein
MIASLQFEREDEMEREDEANSTAGEIEVTPEMIDAGVGVFLLGWSSTDAEAAVECIFRAMRSAMSKAHKVDYRDT